MAGTVREAMVSGKPQKYRKRKGSKSSLGPKPKRAG